MRSIHQSRRSGRGRRASMGRRRRLHRRQLTQVHWLRLLLGRRSGNGRHRIGRRKGSENANAKERGRWRVRCQRNLLKARYSIWSRFMPILSFMILYACISRRRGQSTSKLLVMIHLIRKRTRAPLTTPTAIGRSLRNPTHARAHRRTNNLSPSPRPQRRTTRSSLTAYGRRSTAVKFTMSS